MDLTPPLPFFRDCTESGHAFAANALARTVLRRLLDEFGYDVRHVIPYWIFVHHVVMNKRVYGLYAIIRPKWLRICARSTRSVHRADSIHTYDRLIEGLTSVRTLWRVWSVWPLAARHLRRVGRIPRPVVRIVLRRWIENERVELEPVAQRE